MIVLVISLVLATAVGLAVQRRNGRFRGVRHDTAVPSAPPEATLAVPGARATFVQISAEHCAVCPAVARALNEVATNDPGVAHVELRAEENLGLVRRFDVRRSPTVLLVDAAGHVVARTSGAMTVAQARAALTTLPTPTPTPGAPAHTRTPTRPTPAAHPDGRMPRATEPLEEPIDARF